jgi:hypothetical protein
MKLHPRSLLPTLLAVAAAAWLAGGPPAPPYTDQLLGVAVRQTFAEAAPQIASEPPEVQALLLDYADRPELLLKARSALLRYPDLARRLLPLYGSEPEFQGILLDYGEAVLPPIAYFMDHDLTSLELRRALGEQVETIRHFYGRFIGSPSQPTASDPPPALTPELRGWYAVNFLHEEGYDFLGQFTVSADGKADWVQSRRVLEGMTDLFLGGIRGLETKWRRGDEIENGDLGWAALDVAVIAASVKLVKAVRAARAIAPVAGGASTEAMGISTRVALFGSRVLARGSRLGIAVARYGAVPAAAYLMIRYPSLINATMAELAGWLGLEPWAVQFLFWFLVASVTLRLALFLLGPLSRALRGLGWLTGTLAAWFQSPHERRRIAPRAV